MAVEMDFFSSDENIQDKQLIHIKRIYNFTDNSEMSWGSGEFKELEIFEINIK